MTVLHVVPGDGSRNSMIFVRRQVAHLEAAGIATHVFALGSRTNPLGLVREGRRLRRMVRALRPDVVHLHFGTVTAAVGSAFAPAPLVITYRGSDLNPAPGMSWWRSALGRLMSQLAALRATRIICVSQQLRGRLWWRRDLVAVIPSGVDLDRFTPVPRARARAMLGWPADRPIVLFNAGASPAVKRADLARAAVAQAKTTVPEIDLVVLDGSLPPDDMPMLLAAASCVLLTSEFEGSPNIIKEALACNIPIVAVPVGDVPERLAGVAHCRLVAPDAGALGSAIAELVAVPLETNGRDAVESISGVNVARKILEVYAQAVEEWAGSGRLARREKPI